MNLQIDQFELLDNVEELLTEINKYIKPKQKEKQENGEVFTPMNIVFELLDALDADYDKVNNKSIFTEADFKWLDPASGIGNFIIGVYLRLMRGLELQIPEYNVRKKHIIENMLYMSEINKSNVLICKKIYNPYNYYKVNIYEGDTLELDVLNAWGLESKFDVILGNPPYNKGSIGCTRKKAAHKTNGKYEAIWPKFVAKSFSLLKHNGFLVFITPLSWLKYTHAMHSQLLEKQILWLKLWDNSKGLEKLNGKIPISLFILQNCFNTEHKKTKILSEIKSRRLISLSMEYLDPRYSIPIAFHSIFNKLLAFIEKHNLQLEYKIKTIQSMGEKIKIPDKFDLSDMLAVDTYTIKEGILVKKAIGVHQDANKRKLIISNKSSFTGAFIDEGKLGLTGSWKSYILGDNLELILQLLSFRICNIISHYTKYKQDFLELDVYTFLPDIRKLGIIKITEYEFYELLELTQQEISQIELCGV